jgi:hypothetical protein
MGFSLHDSASGEVMVGNLHAGGILLTSTGGTCGDITANQAHQNEKGVFIDVWDVVGTTTNAPTAAGTYSIYQGTGTSPPKAASLSAIVFDATCKEITGDGAKATTGTVTLTAVSGTKYNGTFDVALDSGDHVTGSFEPEECPGLNAYVAVGNNAACI